MSAFFTILLESETWMQSLPNASSENLPLVWNTLDQIAEEKGLTPLNRFVTTDKEYYQEELEAELADPNPDEVVSAERVQQLRERIAEFSEQPEWFSAEDAGQAAQIMQSLVEHLHDNPNLFSEYGDDAHEVFIDELEGTARFLNKVQSRNIRFKFYME